MKAEKFILLLIARKAQDNIIAYFCIPAAAQALNPTTWQWNGLDKVSFKGDLVICIINIIVSVFYEKPSAYPVAKLGELLETLVIFYDM